MYPHQPPIQTASAQRADYGDEVRSEQAAEAPSHRPTPQHGSSCQAMPAMLESLSNRKPGLRQRTVPTKPPIRRSTI